ncbi:uncharacterized protein TrAFT101_001046 [Trichoderma asperellum]|uniref:uncharacterized protein n=1 Tax=Trichoderma asperellum TaxID=101201 RepID=UPI0033285B44|nr:hypothetical protein TrAFT101_001046 [Trichoderma asperellum]
MASSSQKGKDDIASTISKLSISSGKKPTASKKAKEPVADSWEDEDVSDEEAAAKGEEIEEEEEVDAGTSTPSSLATPASQSPLATSASGTGSGSGTPPARRPEKTDAVARRLIAAGLGMKAPRQTEEQRAYQRSVREQEKKRREEAKAEEERRKTEADKAKMAVWED